MTGTPNPSTVQAALCATGSVPSAIRGGSRTIASNYARAVCACEPPTVIRVSPRALARSHIMCALCTTVFTKDE
jgi:hypothetical protein